MRTHWIEKTANAAAMLALALAISGCASSGYRKGYRIGSALQTSAGRIEIHLAKLDAAVTALNDLVNNPQADLRPQFKQFSAAMGKPGALADTIREADRDMQTRGAVYFDEWDLELAVIQNQEIRRRGQDRKIEVLQQYDAVRSDCLKAQAEISPLEADLWDIHRFLNTDLTPGGLQAIKDATSRVNQLAGPVHDSVSKLATDMRALGLAMSPLNATK